MIEAGSASRYSVHVLVILVGGLESCVQGRLVAGRIGERSSVFQVIQIRCVCHGQSVPAFVAVPFGLERVPHGFCLHSPGSIDTVFTAISSRFRWPKLVHRLKKLDLCRSTL